VQAVHYGQSVSLDGFELSARPYPAGAAFGGALWALSDGSRSIAYLPQFGLPSPPTPPGQVPPPLAAALELEPATLSHHDVLILGPGAVQCSPAGGAGGGAGRQPPFSQLCITVADALRAGGPCLLPLPPSGDGLGIRAVQSQRALLQHNRAQSNSGDCLCSRVPVQPFCGKPLRPCLQLLPPMASLMSPWCTWAPLPQQCLGWLTRQWSS
jgi:hypothetical protein